MHPVIPLWVTLVTIAANIMIPIVAWVAFQRVARRLARELVAPSFVFFALWVVVALTLSARGFLVGAAGTTVPRNVYALVPQSVG